MTSIELLICILLVGVSGYMSSSEIALFSLSRFQIRAIRDRAKSTHKKIRKLLADPGGLLITILLANELVNISLSALLTEVVSRSRKLYWTIPTPLPDWALDMFLGTVVTAPILLFLCEVTPKVIGARANQLIASFSARPMNIIYDLFKPIRILIKGFLALLTPAGPQSVQAAHDLETGRGAILKESEFLMMVEEGHKEGAIQETELGLIRNVFNLDDTRVSEVFTPLAQVRTLSAQTSLKAALAGIRGVQYSRIPVVSADRKQVIGIVYSKDLLRAKLEPEKLLNSVSQIMRKPQFISPEARLNLVFRKFKQQKTHLAVVQNEFGISLGIITMSDIFDVLFEDLFEESDNTEAALAEEITLGGA